MDNANHASDNDGQTTEKMNMADCFITAMFLPKEYGKLLRVSAGRIIGYLTLLVLLIAVIQYAIPPLAAITSMGGVKNIILNEIPDFSLKDGVFSYAEKYEKQDDDMGVYIVVDTEKEQYTKDDIPADAAEAVMVSKSNMLLYNNVPGIGGLIQENIFKRDFKGVFLDNQTIADQSLLIYFFMGFLFIGAYVIVLVKYLIVSLLYAVVMYLLASTMMMGVTYGTVYKIALFAQSLGTVVFAATCCIGSSVFVLAGNIFNMLATVIILNKALLQIKLEQDAVV